MLKYFFLVMCCCFFWVKAQDKIIKNHSLGFSLVGGYQFIQDTKFSKLQNTGLGYGGDIFYKKNIKSGFFELGFLGFISKTSPSELDINYNNFSLNIYVRGLKSISDNFMLGGELTFLDFIYSQTKFLENNRIYFNSRYSSNIIGSYKHKKFKFEFSYALFSMMKELPSFTFSSTQHQVENREYTYSKRSSIYSLEDYRHYFFWEHINIRTSLKLRITKSIEVFYRWRYKNQSVVKNYESSYGVHNLGATYIFKI